MMWHVGVELQVGQNKPVASGDEMISQKKTSSLIIFDGKSLCRLEINWNYIYHKYIWDAQMLIDVIVGRLLISFWFIHLV